METKLIPVTIEDANENADSIVNIEITSSMGDIVEINDVLSDFAFLLDTLALIEDEIGESKMRRETVRRLMKTSKQLYQAVHNFNKNVTNVQFIDRKCQKVPNIPNAALRK